jgi:hypothetical protein
LHFLEADRLAGEDGTEVNFFAAETDAAAIWGILRALHLQSPSPPSD